MCVGGGGGRGAGSETFWRSTAGSEINSPPSRGKGVIICNIRPPGALSSAKLLWLLGDALQDPPIISTALRSIQRHISRQA